MNTLDKKYQDLLREVLNQGVEKGDRTGTGTISLFGKQLRHNMSEGFPVLTTKKFAFKTMVTELLWFLSGSTNIKYLVDNNCHIWDGDCYKAYLSKETTPGTPPHDHVLSKDDFIDRIKNDKEFSDKFGELGPIYGKQWRDWNNTGSNGDQISNLILELKDNPDSRRLMVNAWNPEAQPEMTLPPCHYGFQVYTRPTTRDEKIVNHGKYRAISLMFNLRSSDVPLGLPFNIASYGLLLEILAKMTDMVPDELIVNLGDTHIYKNQVDGIKKQITREPYKLPTLDISDDVDFSGSIDDFLESCDKNSFHLKNYQHHPSIKMPLSN
jgi:thymidylate synthase